VISTTRRWRETAGTSSADNTLKMNISPPVFFLSGNDRAKEGWWYVSTTPEKWSRCKQRRKIEGVSRERGRRAIA
jgi:hypothetical protein